MRTLSVLEDLVRRVKCKPNWSFSLHMERDVDRSDVLRLVITVDSLNSRSPKSPLRVSHFFPVPEATFNEKTWRRWLFEQCRRVENHELGEWFTIGNERPFAPLHGPGEDPYTIHEFRDVVDAHTNQDGSVYK